MGNKQKKAKAARNANHLKRVATMRKPKPCEQEPEEPFHREVAVPSESYVNIPQGTYLVVVASSVPIPKRAAFFEHTSREPEKSRYEVHMGFADVIGLRAGDYVSKRRSPESLELTSHVFREAKLIINGVSSAGSAYAEGAPGNLRVVKAFVREDQLPTFELVLDRVAQERGVTFETERAPGKLVKEKMLELAQRYVPQ